MGDRPARRCSRKGEIATEQNGKKNSHSIWIFKFRTSDSKTDIKGTEEKGQMEGNGENKKKKVLTLVKNWAKLTYQTRKIASALKFRELNQPKKSQPKCLVRQRLVLFSPFPSPSPCSHCFSASRSPRRSPRLSTVHMWPGADDVRETVRVTIRFAFPFGRLLRQHSEYAN